MFNVGEKIALSIGTNSEYLKDYIERNVELLSERVTAQTLEIKQDDLTKEKDKVFGQLNLCTNKTCSASLKENILSKLEKNTETNCPYCNTKLKKEGIKTITFNFLKIYSENQV